MRKITIGRGRECDIRLSDSTDKVSRRQAIITFTLMGKMNIYDTSSNGTFVNGEKVEKPAGRPIKRGDQINFAHIADLDWSKVKDPYQPVKLTIVVTFVVMVILIGLFLIFGDSLYRNDKKIKTMEVEVVAPAVPTDTLVLQIPEETPMPRAVNKTMKTKESGSTPNPSNVIKSTQNDKSKKTTPQTPEPRHEPTQNKEPEVKAPAPPVDNELQNALKDK